MKSSKIASKTIGISLSLLLVLQAPMTAFASELSDTNNSAETAIQIDKAALEKIKMEEYQVLDKDKKPISLMTFNFQLNQLLMLINNPMLFPHRAYVGLFNED